MAQHQSFVHDERILQALLRLTRGTEQDCWEDPTAIELPLDSDPLSDAIETSDWDVLVRSRPPRA